MPKRKPLKFKRQKTRLLFPLKIGCPATGYMGAVPGVTERQLYDWNENDRYHELIINEDLSHVGQHRALLRALMEWATYHLEGTEMIDRKLTSDEVAAHVDILLDMMISSGLYVVSYEEWRNDMKNPKFEFKEMLSDAESKYLKRSKWWTIDRSMVGGGDKVGKRTKRKR